jgi:phospholipase C
LPDPGPKVAQAAMQCGPNVALGYANAGIPFPVPPNRMPRQEPGTRRAPSGLV